MRGSRQNEILYKGTILLAVFIVIFYILLWLQPGEAADLENIAELPVTEELSDE